MDSSKPEDPRSFADWVFMIVLAFLGIFLIVVPKRAMVSLPDTCQDRFVLNSLTALMFIGVVQLTVAVSFVFCNMRLKCYANGSHFAGDDPSGKTPRTAFYLVFGLIMALACIGLSVSVIVQLNGTCGSTDAKFYLYGTVALSSFVCVANIAGLAVVAKIRKAAK